MSNLFVQQIAALFRSFSSHLHMHQWCLNCLLIIPLAFVSSIDFFIVCLFNCTLLLPCLCALIGRCYFLLSWMFYYGLGSLLLLTTRGWFPMATIGTDQSLYDRNGHTFVYGIYAKWSMVKTKKERTVSIQIKKTESTFISTVGCLFCFYVILAMML